MTFREKYAALELEFREQVENDNKEFLIKSSYLPNLEPIGPVDYVLVAMEPSTDARIIAWFKAHARNGRGYQTDINGALREHVQRTARSAQ